MHSTLLCFITEPQVLRLSSKSPASGILCASSGRVEIAAHPHFKRRLLLTGSPDFRPLCSWKPQPDAHPSKRQSCNGCSVLAHHTHTQQCTDPPPLRLAVVGLDGATLGPGLPAHICVCPPGSALCSARSSLSPTTNTLVLCEPCVKQP